MDKRETNSDHEMEKDNLQIFTYKKMFYDNYYSLRLFLFNYLQLLYREIKGSLVYQGFPRPILPTKHPERTRG